MKLAILQSGDSLSTCPTSSICLDTTGQGNRSKNANTPGNLDTPQLLDLAANQIPDLPNTSSPVGETDTLDSVNLWPAKRGLRK
jgi:hypothetical protein